MLNSQQVRNDVSGVVVGNVIQARSVETVLPRPMPLAVSGLPRLPVFVGRENELSEVQRALTSYGDISGGSPLVVIAGLAGVGKTSTAVKAAQDLLAKGRFAGGSVMVDLHGYDVPEHRVPTGSALASLLSALGIPREHVPAQTADRERLWRTVLAEKAAAGQFLVVIIDNASSADQVRPLLPGTAAHGVLVTSRHSLVELDGARLVRLGVLPSVDAGLLLRRQLAVTNPRDERVRTRSDEADTIGRLCGGLPLAVRITAALLAADPDQPLSEMSATLADEHRRLDELNYDGSLAVRSAFDLSYRNLGEPEARLFRLLALNPSPEFGTGIAQVATGASGSARRLLDRLRRAHLVEPGSARGRWRMHDLVRLYARELVGGDEGGADAFNRIINYYSALCTTTDRLLTQAIQSPVGLLPDEVLDGLDVELPNIVGAVLGANEAGMDDVVLRTAKALHRYLDLRKRWDEWIVIDGVALAAARRVGDRHAESRILNHLGIAYRDVRRLDDAIDCHQRSLAHFRELDDRVGEAETLNYLAIALRKRGRFDEAIDLLDEAARIWRTTEDRLGSARVRNNLGLTCYAAGAHEDAIEHYRQAAELLKTVQDPQRMGKVLHNNGVACTALGRHEEAHALLTHALAIRRDLGDRHRQAKTLAALGRVQGLLGARADAAESYRQALDVFRTLGDRTREAQVRRDHLAMDTDDVVKPV
ncbi:tetratricopeptide repeat protein [Saccharothrix xinjiangensis]|uniref:Tetratricopeptide repeat protein n=1 Tax=Saccharothrix xinjiangensis TaxID=204798 RepID=A0ABV9Y1M1_9PSEU